MIPKSSVAACMLLVAMAAAPHAVPLLHASPSARSPLGGGGGEPPDIELSTTSLLFGDVHLGGVVVQSVVVSNVGPGELDVSMVFTGSGASHYYLKDPLGPFQVAPSGQTEVILCFFPGAIGTQEATLEFHSNDPVDPLASVSLSGNGYEANLVSLNGVPDPVLVNGSMNFVVVLDAPAGPGDVAVEIATTASGLITVPPTVYVPQGAIAASFPATAGSVTGVETVYALLHSLSVYHEIEVRSLVGVDEAPPNTLWLAPVVPNPVRRATRVAFALPTSARVRLGVFDLAGRSVASLADGVFPAGRNEVPWNPATIRGGMYLLRLEAMGETRVVKAVVMQ